MPVSISMIDPKLVEMTYEAPTQEREYERLKEVANVRHQAHGEGLGSRLAQVLAAVSFGLQAGHRPFATR
jgi:hypothetical protein